MVDFCYPLVLYSYYSVTWLQWDRWSMPGFHSSHLPTLVGGDWSHGMTCMTFQKQLGMENHPNWRTHSIIFQRGRSTTNQNMFRHSMIYQPLTYHWPTSVCAFEVPPPANYVAPDMLQAWFDNATNLGIQRVDSLAIDIHWCPSYLWFKVAGFRWVQPELIHSTTMFISCCYNPIQHC